MPVSLAKIVSNSSTVEVAWGDDVVSVTYFPGKITEKTMAEMRVLSSMKQDTESVIAGYTALNTVLIQLIKEWDVFEDDKMTVPYPLTQHKLSELPLFFRVAVIKAILGDFRPEALAPQEKIAN
jgi:hypothetical protein